jgi:hypothetical protein
MRAWGARETVASDGAVVVEAGELTQELRDAYQRGRRDERLQRRRSPLLTISLVAIAAIGAVVLFYAAREGSFSSGGQVVDAKLSHVTTQVVPGAVNDAASATGSALQTAGQRLKDKGAALDKQASNTPASN